MFRVGVAAFNGNNIWISQENLDTEDRHRIISLFFSGVIDGVGEADRDVPGDRLSGVSQ